MTGFRDAATTRFASQLLGGYYESTWRSPAIISTLPSSAGTSPKSSVALKKHPVLVNEKGGPWNWEPILYLCYGRLPLDAARDNAVAIARLLLDRGADPNAYYMAGHALYGTLVGVAGEGEQEATPHPHREALYALLLECGAELYDIQVLYNSHFTGDILWWLRLTYTGAVGRSSPTPPITTAYRFRTRTRGRT